MGRGKGAKRRVCLCSLVGKDMVTVERWEEMGKGRKELEGGKGQRGEEWEK